jgi:hypothetical protein
MTFMAKAGSVLEKAADRRLAGTQQFFRDDQGRKRIAESQGIVIDQHPKTRGLCVQHSGKAERPALDLSGLEAGYDLRETAHPANHYITIRHEAILPEIDPREKIRDRADAGNTDALATEFLDSLHLWSCDSEHDDAVHRDGDINRIGAGEPGVNAGGAADRSDIDASTHQGLHRTRSCGDVNQLDVETVALEDARLFGDPRDRKSRRDRRIGHAQFFRRFAGSRRVHAQETPE